MKPPPRTEQQRRISEGLRLAWARRKALKQGVKKMPQIIIDISKEQEAQIMASVERRADFIIDGGTINPGNEKLRTIKFEFLRSPDVDKPNEQLPEVR